MPVSKSPLLWGGDLYKGWFFNKNSTSTSNISEIFPFQMLSLEEKTPEWLKAVADYYEIIGWNNVQASSRKIQKNIWMRNGVLNPTDYVVNPSENEYYEAINIINCNQDSNPLQMFYPLVPNLIDLLKGEFLKSDKTFTVDQIDQYAIVELLKEKESALRESIISSGLAKKEIEMQNMGLVPKDEESFQKYKETLDLEKKILTETEGKVKNFRTVGSKWANKVLKIHERKYNLEELEGEAFDDLLTNNREFWELDMKDDDFDLRLLNVKYCDWHKGPNIKYVSEGDYFLYFDFLSVGDIIDQHGKDLKDEDVIRLKETYNKVVGSIVTTDTERYGQMEAYTYYDNSKPYLTARDVNPRLNDAILAKELSSTFPKGPNFDHNYAPDIFDNSPRAKKLRGEPQMFRKMTLYWKSLKRIGWLTKRDRDGQISFQGWIDEDYKITEETAYDNSHIKEKSKKTLVYGDHIDWEWVTEWRKIIKINANENSTFWQQNTAGALDPIYIGGDPTPFQFKGDSSPYGCLPPVEGCVFTYKNMHSHGFLDRLYPFQILHNIAWNKVPSSFMNDYGPKLFVDKRSVPRGTNKGIKDNPDIWQNYQEDLRDSFVQGVEVSKETAEGLGQQGFPQLVNLSTVEQSMAYINIAQRIKMAAGEVVGITVNRPPTSTDTAFGLEQRANYQESETKKYFEDHANLMRRVRQRMLDAAQYYSTFNKTSQQMYLNEKEETELLQIEGMQNLLATYNIRVSQNANQKEIKKLLFNFLLNENTLNIRASDKIESMVSNSIPDMLSAVKRGDILAQRNEEQQREQAYKQHQESLANVESIKKIEAEAKAKENQLNRDSDKEIALIKTYGGIQTDANMNNQLDSKENIDLMMRSDKMDIDRNLSERALKLKELQHNDNIKIKEKELDNKMIMKQKELAVAVANTNKSTDKQLNTKIAKSQNIIKNKK